MNLEEFKTLSIEQLKAYGDTILLGSTYDSNGNELTYKKSNRFWYERTRDSNGNILAYKKSNGFWCDCTYDSNNNLLTYKDSNRVNRIGLIKGAEYALYYDTNSKQYIAGCQKLTYNDCIQFYNKFKDKHTDAELFLETIKQHNLDNSHA